MNHLFLQLKGGLTVSCQAEGDSPFNSPEGVGNFARTALMGGAVAIRSCGIEKLQYIKKNIALPLIGLTKGEFPDGTVCITGSFKEAEAVIRTGADIVAVDATFRLRENGLTGPEFISELRRRHPEAIIMGDISTVEEAVAAAGAGADCVSTTLAGYTPRTATEALGGPSLDTLAACVEALPLFPVFAEGRYNTPAEAAKGIAAGAWSVVVGSAITRPHLITRWFVDAISAARQE